MGMMHKARIEVELSSAHEAWALYVSLKPEALAMSSRGLTSTLMLEETKVEIRIEASSLSRLRAALNSYLRWLSSFNELVELALGKGSKALQQTI